MTTKRVVLVAGLAAIAGSALVLLLTGGGEIRYSADHGGTVPMWHRWIPALAGIVAVRLLTSSWGTPLPAARVATQAWVLLGLAVSFAVALRVEPGAFTVLKGLLLYIAPMVLFGLLRGRGEPLRPEATPTVAWWRGPVLPVAVFLLLSYATPLALPISREGRDMGVLTLLGTLAAGFVINALLEEVFYRRWLQTRWEILLGPWPAIVLSSIVWAVWHIGIQGTGPLLTDVAATLVNQGVLGLFLGYLWSAYRRMWPLLVVHGALNSLGLLLGLR